MLNGNRKDKESKSAPSAATPESTNATSASASHNQATGSSGTAITANGQALHPKHCEWIENRGLSVELAKSLGLATIAKGGKNWLVVPYQHKGETINRKWRLTSEKQHMMDKGAPLSLCNADCLSEFPQEVIITEGEWDMMAAIQAGFQSSVSVPNGATKEVSENPHEAQRYSWVERHLTELDKVKKFTLATDNDEAGYALAADLAAIFGPERCRFVEYPFPCKDLNEVLQEYGEQAVVKCLSQAKDYPVKGLYSIDDFPEQTAVRSFPIGVDPIRDYIEIVPGTLTVVTGFANMGKSTLMNAIIGHQLRYNFPVLVASFETDVKPILRDGLRCSIMHCAKSDLQDCDTSDADEILSNGLSIITQAIDDDLELDLDEFLSICRTAVIRNGVKMIVLDPWNEMEHRRKNSETETEYISRALRQIKKFAKVNDVAFWVVAHPSKPETGSKRAPGLYDISGSANWANKADYGLVYHRGQPTGNEAEIIITKVRMGLPGKKGTAPVKFDHRVSGFVANQSGVGDL